MKKALHQLENYYQKQSTETERPALLFLINNTREAVNIDIHTMARRCFCSPSTIVRLCHKNGFSGFKELKLALLSDLKYSDELTSFKSTAHSLTERIAYALNENIQAISDTYALADIDELNRIGRILVEADYIYLYGIGASFLVAKDFQQKMERLAKRTFLHEDYHLQLINATNMRLGEIALIITYSGNTPEIIEIAKHIKQRGGQIIAVTQYSHSPIASLADFKIYVPMIEAPLRFSASSSRVSSLSVIDMIYQAMIFNSDEHEIGDRILSTMQLVEKYPHEHTDKTDNNKENRL